MKRLKLTILLLMIQGVVFADVVFLKSGELMEGQIVSIQASSIDFKEGEQIKTVLKSQIDKIQFIALSDLDKQDPYLPGLEKNKTSQLSKASPVDTFEKWRQFAIVGDVDGMVSCYASFRQHEIKKELKKLPKSKRKNMLQATAQTQFTTQEPYYQGDRAMLEVNWQSGLYTDTQVLQFVLEDETWKIVQ